MLIGFSRRAVPATRQAIGHVATWMGVSMAGEKILVVEDDEDIQELLKVNLAREGFTVLTAADGPVGLQLAQSRRPDLVVLDLMLPRLDGMEVCRQLKRDPRTAAVPIVMLTAKSEEGDIVTGLELGADDYVTKPFSVKVLVTRIRTALRRQREPAANQETPITIHDLSINPGRHEVLLKGKPIEMTFSELRILHLLASRPGWVLTRGQIVETVHGADYPVTDRSVDVQVVNLRRKLGARADYIETVRGVGYRFRE